MAAARRDQLHDTCPAWAAGGGHAAHRDHALAAGPAAGEFLPLRLFEPPLDLPSLRISLQWHRSRERDGATTWLRNLILDTARDVGYRA